MSKLLLLLIPFISLTGEIKLPQNWQPKDAILKDDQNVQWALYQLWPVDKIEKNSYIPLKKHGSEWIAAKNGFGGQPALKIENNKINFSCRSSWSGNPGEKTAAVGITLNKAGTFKFNGRVQISFWSSQGGVLFYFLRKNINGEIEILKRYPLGPHKMSVEFKKALFKVSEGDEIILLPSFPGMHVAGNVVLENFSIERVKE